MNTISIIYGRTHSGKTTDMLTRAVNCVKSKGRHNVIIISTEMNLESLIKRYSYIANSIDESVKDVKFLCSYKYEEIIEYLREQGEFTDLFFDVPDMMSITNMYENVQNYERIVNECIHRMFDEFNCNVIMTRQLGRKSCGI